MNLLRTLVVLAFIVTAGNLSAAYNLTQKDCDKIEFKLDVQPTSNGFDNGQVKVDLTKGDFASAKFIFCQEDGKVLNEGQFEVNTMEGLKRGKYLCIISTADCTKKVTFTIK